MDEIARLPVPGGRGAARAAWGWVTRPRHIALSPLGGLAIATGVAALALVLSGRRPGSAPPAAGTPLVFEFVVVAPRAASVSLVGDFNDWDAARTPMRPSQRGGPLWTAAIDPARAAGLPTEPLVQRALEGATKGAPGPLIVSAVQRLAADLGRAREALGPGTTPPELEAGAAALRAGAGPAVLTQLRRARRQTIAVPLAVLTDLVASGVPVDSAAAAVLALAARARA